MRRRISLFIYIFTTLFVCSFFLVACDNSQMTKDEANNIYEEVSKDIQDEYYLGDTINIYENEKVSYSFSREGYISDTLEIIQDNEFNDILITIIFTIDKYSFTKDIKIKQNIDGLFKQVFDYIEGFIPTTYTATNLNLPTSCYLDKEISITYTSSNPEIVTNEGKRIDHEYDEDIYITCTLTKDDITRSKDFNVYSRGIDYKLRYKKAIEYIQNFLDNTELEEGTILPTTLPNYGGRFRWVCEDPTVIYDYKTIHLPKEAKTSHLLVEIQYSSSVDEVVQFEVYLNKRDESITDFIYMKTFYETVLGNVNDYFTIYNGEQANINTEYLIDETNVKNIEFYKTARPVVPQEKLDELFYEGYQNPNEENIIWIVVHDTGISYAGKDALTFAKNQWYTAYEYAERDASWGYTVDDHSIYQSYQDYLALWHATDGRTIGGGNYNGIGIEMCVNNDGNLELAILNDARLIAHLLLKYNLGMLNMAQHHDFYETKVCPEKLINSKRWFYFLTLTSQEYISQSILKNNTIIYSVDLEETPVKDIYDASNIESGEVIDITISINGEEFTIHSIKN